MTTEEIIKYYVDLLIIQYKSKPKARAHIETIIKNIIADQIYTQVRDAYDLETATGKQLDILGKYIGLSRVGRTFSGDVSLNDDSYRLALKIKIIQNNFGSSLFEIQNLLFQYFEGAIRAYDLEDMVLSYYFNSSVGPQSLAEFFILQNLLPKPMAVGLASVVYYDGGEFYGFDSYAGINTEASTYNTYADPFVEEKWLTYEDLISEANIVTNNFLLESGDALLKEDDSLLLLENQ
jgi:hypothetical protein